jgi:uncharacterized lipoprotein YbaY
MIRIVSAALLAAFLASCAQPAQDVTTSGELYYTEQVNLPPTATAAVELTSPQFDQPTLHLASAEMPAPGMTIPYTLKIAGKDMPKTGPFVLKAYIKDGDRYFFASGDVQLSRADLDKPQRIELHYAPPTPLMYKCDGKWYEVTVDLGSAKVRYIDEAAPATLAPVLPGPGGGKQEFSDNKYTIIADGRSIALGLGKAEPAACILGKP